MKIEGSLLKMETEIGTPIKYQLSIGDNKITLNSLIGKNIHFQFSDEIFCTNCGRKTKKSWAQGFCYNCMQTAPQASPCILRPELCEAHNGISRDMEWAANHCLQPHVVYLALSNEVKVGVTRKTQIPTRWIDQGAWKIIELAETPNRNLAGQIEVALKKFYVDKTNWRKMLTNELSTNTNLLLEKEKATNLLPENLKQFATDNNTITTLNFPVESYPTKVKSISFDNIKTISGKLSGIKAQYLLFDNQNVLNIRKHTGYFVQFWNE